MTLLTSFQTGQLLLATANNHETHAHSTALSSGQGRQHSKLNIAPKRHEIKNEF